MAGDAPEAIMDFMYILPPIKAVFIAVLLLMETDVCRLRPESISMALAIISVFTVDQLHLVWVADTAPTESTRNKKTR